MRRSLLIALGAMALVLAVPSAALAHHGRGHRYGRHHHHHFHTVHIGKGASGAPTTATENAGTIASYENNVLTLTLKDGSSVSGKVTNFTRIRCLPATPPPGNEEMGGSGSGEGGSGPGWKDGKGSWHGPGDKGESGPPSFEPQPPCDSSSLVAGTVVRAAELRVGPSGSEFESVWLIE